MLFSQNECAYKIKSDEKVIYDHDKHKIVQSAIGYYVMNTDLPFLDLDKPKWVPMWFHKIATKRRVSRCLSHLDLDGRLYQTAKGLRLMITSKLLATDSADFHELCQCLGCDKLYSRLCRHQKTYRARLTPKPTRIGVRQRRHAASWGMTEELWDQDYFTARDQYATCRLIATFGKRIVPDFSEVVDTHDAWCGVHWEKIDNRPIA